MERVRFPLRGGFSVQSILTFVLAVFTTVILWAILSVSPVEAQATTATWSGTETILFDNHGYTANSEVKDTTGTIPSGATIYAAPVQGTGTSSQKLLVLFFAPGVDPPTATTVKYVEFDFKDGVISSPTTPRDITLTLQGEADPVGSSCSVTGIGWVICPISVWLAEGMDWLFGMLSDLIKVQPLTLGTTNDSMYQAWNIMRTIANIAFVIVFLIIIYAQITNLGVSNYGLKKLIPRLIIAAVLVNVSFFITALAIDISNVLGYSVQDIFNSIREQVFRVTNDDISGVNTDGGWAALTAIVLAGGGYFGVSYLVTGGATILLVPILLGLGLTLLFVFLILAARQAIIVILVIISPLAFVAYLLPNTEKWFEKWKDIFMTMLIFFPAFSLVFGGSQLAGQIIIQNAGDNIVMLILGMAVQIAPLVITPLILKLSGGLLGKIAQIANDPRKGILDRNKAWAEEKAAIRRQKTLGTTPKGGKFRRAVSPGAGRRLLDNNRRARKETLDTFTMAADNKWHSSDRYGKLHDRKHDVETDKKIVDANLEIRSVQHTRSHAANLQKDMTARIRADQAADLKGRLDNTYDELKSGSSTLGSSSAAFSGLEAEAVEATRAVALNAMRQQSAKRAQSQNLYQELKDNTLTVEGQVLRTYAGGVQGHIGAQRALAQAISEQHRAHSEVITNANAILDDYNLSAAENLEIARAVAVPNKVVDITADIQEAAIKRVAGNGVIPHIEELLKSVDFSPTGNEDFRLALVEALKGNGSRPKFIGYGTMDKITQGIAGGINDGVIDDWIEGMLVEGKLSAKELAGQDKDTLIRIQQAIPRLNGKTGRSPQEQVLFFKGMANLREEVAAVRKDEELWNAAGERKKVIDDIDRAI